MKILFVDSLDPVCGVFQYGLNVCNTLRKYHSGGFNRLETQSEEELLAVAPGFDKIIYNYHPFTFQWFKAKKVIPKIAAEQYMITGHDHWHTFDGIRGYIDCSDYENIPRPLVETALCEPPDDGKIHIGTFGFPFANKGVGELGSHLRSFRDAKLQVNLHLTRYPHGDTWRDIERSLHTLRILSGVDISISHNFLTGEEIVQKLSKNHLNFFLYKNERGRGLSSSLDYALAARRPIALSDSEMFRHVSWLGKTQLSQHSMSDILGFGTGHLEGLWNKWSGENLYKSIIKIIS